MAQRGRPRKIENLFTPPKSNTQFSEGQKSKGILDDFALRKTVDTQEGTIESTPTNPKDIANKAYVDSAVAGAGGTDWTVDQSPLVIHAANYVDNDTTYVAGDFDHDDLGSITGTAGQYNHPTDANMTVLNNTSGANTGDQDISGIAVNAGDITYLSGTVVAGLSGNFDNLSAAYIAHEDDTTIHFISDGIMVHVNGDGSDHADVAANTVSCGTIAAISAATLTNISDISYLSGTIVAGDIADMTYLSGTVVANLSEAVTANTLSCATIANISAATLLNTAHKNDNTQAHSDYLTNNADDTMVGVLTMSGGIVSADNTTISTGIIRNIILGTDETPPTASGFVTGTLYVQYTA